MYAGLTDQNAGYVYNSAVIIGWDGLLLALHRILNELDMGQVVYSRGDRLGMANTDMPSVRAPDHRGQLCRRHDGWSLRELPMCRLFDGCRSDGGSGLPGGRLDTMWKG